MMRTLGAATATVGASDNNQLKSVAKEIAAAVAAVVEVKRQ